MTAVDLARLSYNEWLDFVFGSGDEEAGPGKAGEDWYWKRDIVVSDEAQLLRYFQQLCREFPAVVLGFSPTQVNQGIWLLLGPKMRIGEYLFNPSIELSLRLGTTRAMYFVFRDYVWNSRIEVMENCFQMWWDLILKGVREGTSRDDLDASIMRESILATLQTIVSLPDGRCQEYALHGLGHLQEHLPDQRTRDFLDAWIGEHRAHVPAETIAWVERCRDGTAM